jgi:uncharacterized protein (DUF983 family)
MRRLQAILLMRCPHCLRGRVFRGPLAMNRTCPCCGLLFQQEPGYFLGAMYISYPLATIVLAALTFLIRAWLPPSWSFNAALALALPPFLLFVPAIFRYSRVLWLHFDTQTH